MRHSGLMKLLKLMLASSLALGVISTQAMAVEGKRSSKMKSGSKKKKKMKRPKSRKKAPIEAAAPTESDAPQASSSSRKELLLNLGLSPSPLVAFGGTLGFLGETGSGLELSGTYGSGKSGTIGAKVMHFGARYRMGMMKVGYIAAGAGFRMASGNWFVLNKTQDAEYKAGATLNAVTIDGALGTQFQFGSFLVGADLVGFSYPAFKMGVKNTKPTEEDYDPSDADAQQAKFDKLGAGLNLTIFKAGIGLVF